MTIAPGTKIKELRMIAGMSQEELGRRIGVQRAAIQKYEKGVVENIPIKTIEKIATIFDVSPTYIVGWSGDEGNQLAIEVKILQGVKRFYGADCVTLLEQFINLNNKGKRRLQQCMEDISLLYSQNNFDDLELDGKLELEIHKVNK